MFFVNPVAEARQSHLSRVLQNAGRFGLIALVAARPLVSESYDSAGTSISQAIDGLADPWPARTLLFDLIILLSLTAWALSFALDRTIRYRRTGLEWGLAVLCVAAAASCCFAGNKRLAINATLDWLCLPILCLSLVQLIRTAAHRNILIAAIVTSAAVQAGQCFEQYFLGFAETIEQYESGRAEFWARQGIDLDSSTVDSFERRLRAREATGFFSHSNVAGSYLVLCAFAGASILLTRRRSSDGESKDTAMLPLAQVGGALFVVAIAVAVWLTGSKAALLGGFAAAVLAFAAYRLRGWFGRNQRLFFWGAWAAAALGVAAVVGHGMYHDSLPGWSLTFRWQYWTAAAEMIGDHFWTGVGRENFGRVYTAYKDIASPEEVANPHNLLVQAAAEWGILGLGGVVAMMFGVTRRAWMNPQTAVNACGPAPAHGHIVVWLIALGASVVAARGLMLGTFDEYYVFYAAMMAGLIWLPAFAALAYGNNHVLERDAQTMGRIVLGAGLVAIVLQDMVGFAFFVPASGTTFFALLALWITPGLDERPEISNPLQARKWKAAWVASLAVAAAVLFILLILVPVYRSNRLLAQGRSSTPSEANPQSAMRQADYLFAKAAKADPLDPTPWVEAARLAASVPDLPALQQAAAALDEAIARDPRNHSLYRRKSQVLAAKAHHSGDAPEYMGAVDAAAAALERYPQDPGGLVFLADAELEAAIANNSLALVRSAVQHYEEALALDERRLSWETIQRFRPREVEAIHRKLEQAQSLTDRPRS